jgi:hypothetical protein
MTHTPPASRVCPACDGFATVAVTLGGRDRHGHLRTVTAHCPACQGTGTTPLNVRPEHAAGSRA